MHIFSSFDFDLDSFVILEVEGHLQNGTKKRESNSTVAHQFAKRKLANSFDVSSDCFRMK